MPPELDSYDRRILALLQVDSSRSNADIAGEIGLSEAPCWRRVQRLKKEGFIKAQISVLDRVKLGFNTQIFQCVGLRPSHKRFPRNTRLLRHDGEFGLHVAHRYAGYRSL